MLKNEIEEPTAQTPVAQIRVTPEELAAALNTLEADKQEAARQREGTVPIGQVVQEMNLEATPEEVWAQVQKQREQAQRRETEQTTAQAEARGAATVTKRAVTRRVLRGWNEIKGWVWVLFWASGGIGLLSSAPHWFHHGPPPGIQVSGDYVSGPYTVQGTGAQRDAVISGDHDTIMLNGDARNVTVEGDDQTVTVNGSVESVSIDGDNDTVHWTKERPGKPVVPTINGDGSKFGLIGP